MATRLPASQRTREELTALIEGRLSTASAKDELVKLASRLIVEEALEGEAGDALGRDYYEHGVEPGRGSRNSYRTGRLKTAEGLMEYSAPQVAGRDEPFRSGIREHLKGHISSQLCRAAGEFRMLFKVPHERLDDVVPPGAIDLRRNDQATASRINPRLKGAATPLITRERQDANAADLALDRLQQQFERAVARPVVDQDELPSRLAELRQQVFKHAPRGSLDDRFLVVKRADHRKAHGVHLSHPSGHQSPFRAISFALNSPH